METIDTCRKCGVCNALLDPKGFMAEARELADALEKIADYPAKFAFDQRPCAFAIISNVKNSISA